MTPDADFTPIRISTLRGDIKIPFDVYVFVAGKYILYCRSGSSFEGARLDRLKAKKLQAMFVRKEDEIPYRQYLEQSIDSAYDKKGGKDLRIRAEVIQGFQQAAAEQYMDEPLNMFAYHHVLSSVERFVGFVRDEAASVQALLSIPNVDRSISHHGVNVASLATAILLQQNIKEDKTITLVGLGALLHDVEHHYTHLDISGDPAEFPPEKIDTYRAHPLDGARRVHAAKFIDQLVFNIITQHEEHMDGTGFPKKLTGDDMDPLVLVVGAANTYDRLTTFQGLEPKAALKELLIDKMGSYPLKDLQTLQEVLKAQKIV